MTRTEPWTTVKVLAWTKEFLTAKGVENARLESEWLLCAATGLDRVGLYLNFERPLNENELTVYRGMVARRGRREPLQHILGTQEFFGLDFEVSPAVLIPRHDTETLVHEALSRKPDARSVLDIGTGSACLAVTMAQQLPGAAITAIDISHEALVVAQRNAQRHHAHIEFLQGSLFEPVAGRKFDLIISNPPYIPANDIETLAPEVRDFDPRMALDGGLDGLEIYRKLVPHALNSLNLDGWLLVEIGAEQDNDVLHLFHTTAGYGSPVTARDPAGIVRIVGAQRQCK